MNEKLYLTLCLEQDSILVSEAIMRVLGNPRYVQMQFSQERNSLLLRACTYNDQSAWIVPDNPNERGYCGRTLLKRIRSQTDWDDNAPRRIAGTYYEQYNTVVFDLSLAEKTDVELPAETLSGALS